MASEVRRKKEDEVGTVGSWRIFDPAVSGYRWNSACVHCGRQLAISGPPNGWIIESMFEGKILMIHVSCLFQMAANVAEFFDGLRDGMAAAILTTLTEMDELCQRMSPP